MLFFIINIWYELYDIPLCCAFLNSILYFIDDQSFNRRITEIKVDPVYSYKSHKICLAFSTTAKII